MYETCPKCGHQRTDADTAPATECPACGIVFAKWMRQRFRAEDAPLTAAVGGDDDDPGSLPGRLAATLMHVPEKTDPAILWSRVALFAGLVIWGLQFIFMEYYRSIDGHRIDLPVPDIGTSVMHIINTPFHEFGHLLFRPFGELMMYLGGTLGQLLMPAVVIGVFLFKQHDTFAASVGLWWLGQSLMDAAPYINDARNMQIPLIGGGSGSEGRGELHDWHNILLKVNLLHRDHAIADAVDALGVAVMLLAFAWGGAVLYRQYRST